MTNFQIVVTGIFIFFIAVGVILFATFGKGGNTDSIGRVEIWGSVSQEVMDEAIKKLNEADDRAYREVIYKEFENANFNQELAEAIASGTGPDAFVLPQDLIIKHESKIFPIPYETYQLRDFKDKFIEEGELYLTSTGILAFPFMVDPMVMYWNRDIFSANGVSTPPKSWEEFFALSQKITKKDDTFNIFTGLIGLGDYRNIVHAKEIISTLIMQAGNPIVTRDEDGLGITLNDSFGKQIPPAVEAIDFYTQFSNPVKTIYTWNRALPDSKKFFLANDLALYLGFASELPELRALNPNLNFDVTTLPQAENGNVVTYGNMYALAVVKASDNPGGAYRAILALTDDSILSAVAENTGLPPVSRSLLSTPTDDPYLDIFYKSALFSKGWLDPNKEETDTIFKEMIDSILAVRKKTTEAIRQASEEMKIMVEN